MSAIYSNREKELSDLVVLERNEALEFQLKILEAWQPQYEVWPIKHAGAITAASTAISAAFINSHFRKKLRLFNYAKFTTFLPTVVIPAMFASMSHMVFVTNDVLVRDTRCSLCLELKSAACQIAGSLAMPLLLAPAAAFSMAVRHRTFVVPDLTKKSGRLYFVQTMQKFSRPIASKLLLIAAFQGLLGMVLAHNEMKTIARVDMKFAQLEAQSEEFS